jgi:hypothetical protein
LEEYPLLEDPPPEVDPLHDPLRSSEKGAQLLEEEEDVVELLGDDMAPNNELFGAPSSLKAWEAQGGLPALSLDREVITIFTSGPDTYSPIEVVVVNMHIMTNSFTDAIASPDSSSKASKQAVQCSALQYNTAQCSAL